MSEKKETYKLFNLPWYYFAGISMNMTLCVIGIALFVYAESLAGFTLFVINMCFVFLNSIPCKKRNTDGYNILKIIWRHKKSCLKGSVKRRLLSVPI